MICCIIADGDLLKPGLIGLNKSLPIDSFKTTFYNNIYYYYSKTAFINSIIFKEYIFSEIIPYVKKRRSEIGLTKWYQVVSLFIKKNEKKIFSI